MYYKGKALRFQNIRKAFSTTSLPDMSLVSEVVFFGACYIIGAGAFLLIIATLLLF